MAVLTAKLALSRPTIKDQQLFDMAFNLAKRLLTKQMPKEKIRKVMTFLRHYLHFENTEMKAKFEKEIINLTGRSSTMGIEEFLLDSAKKEGRKEGIEEGIEKGIEKGMTRKELEKNLAFTRSLLSSTDFNTLKIAQLVGVSEDFVLKVKSELGK